MANIPVERTGSSGMPWWAWLLGLVLLLGLVWLIFMTTGDDTADTQTTAADTTEQAEERRDDGVLTDPVAVANAPNPRVYEGREVRFDDMRVEVAYSDSLFYAVPATEQVDRRFFVVLGDPGRFGPTGATNLSVGDRVTVHGRLSPPDRDALQSWEVAEDERARLDRLEDYYIRAERVNR